jgi:hypothetical protein
MRRKKYKYAIRGTRTGRGSIKTFGHRNQLRNAHLYAERLKKKGYHVKIYQRKGY